MTRIVLAALAFSLFAVLAGAQEIADIFDPALARRPSPGDWLEYRIAFPVDPLENSLSAQPVRPATAVPVLENEEAESFFFRPEFEPPAAWRVLPLRIEMRESDEESFKVVITFEGTTQETRIPLARPDAAAEFRYEAPQPETVRVPVRIDGMDFEAEVTRRVAENHGFVRYFCPEVPFGIVRFATENVDLALVGMGSERPPEFPLRLSREIHPPMGELFSGGEQPSVAR